MRILRGGKQRYGQQRAESGEEGPRGEGETGKSGHVRRAAGTREKAGAGEDAGERARAAADPAEGAAARWEQAIPGVREAARWGCGGRASRTRGRDSAAWEDAALWLLK